MRWFHSGGIFAALSETHGGADHRRHEGRAKRRRRGVSFDLNFREKLWARVGAARQKRGRGRCGRIVENVDVLVGNEEDLQKGLGIEGIRVTQDDADSIATIRRAIECGLNWIDTAAIYGLGHSEEVVGQALRDLHQRQAVRVHKVQPRVGCGGEYLA